MEDMINALLEVGNLIFNAFEEAFGDFSKENAGFAGWVEKCRGRIREKLLWKLVEQFFCDIGRSADLVIGEIGKAGEHIGIVIVGTGVTHIAELFCSEREEIRGSA